MAIVVGDVLRIVCKMAITGQDVINVFNFKVAVNGALDDADFMTRLAALLDANYGLINEDVANDLIYVVIDGQNITQDVLLPTVPWPVLVNGADLAEILPRQVAAQVFFKTTRPRTRASKFMGGYTEDSNSSVGGLNALPIGRLQLFGDGLVASLTDGTIDVDYGAYNAFLARFTPVISATVSDFWRTQRRRVPGVGS